MIGDDLKVCFTCDSRLTLGKKTYYCCNKLSPFYNSKVNYNNFCSQYMLTCFFKGNDIGGKNV